MRIDAANAPFVGQALGVAAGAPVAFQATNVTQLAGTQQVARLGIQSNATAQGQDKGAEAQGEPSCSSGKAQEIEERLKTLQEQEQRINEKLQRLEECLREFQSSQNTRSSERETSPAVSQGQPTGEPSRLVWLPNSRSRSDGLALLPAVAEEKHAPVKQSSFFEAEPPAADRLQPLPRVDTRRLPPPK